MGRAVEDKDGNLRLPWLGFCKHISASATSAWGTYSEAVYQQVLWLFLSLRSVVMQPGPAGTGHIPAVPRREQRHMSIYKYSFLLHLANTSVL